MTAAPVSAQELGGHERVTGGTRTRVVFVGATVFLAAIIACAVLGPLIAPDDPYGQNLLLGVSGPSLAHPLGTDTLGEDIFSRVIVGARAAVAGAAAVAIGAMIIGNLLGTAAGYLGGATDFVIMRWVDLMYSLPGLLVAIVVVGVLGGTYWTAVALLALLTAPYDARLVRAAVLEQRPRAYVEAAQTLGLSPRRIMFHHIWPNVVPIVVANTFLNFAFSLVTLSALSYLGLGAGPGTPNWGRMLTDNQTLIFTNPGAILGPGAAIVLTAACVNLMGDWLYETLSDRGRAR